MSRVTCAFLLACGCGMAPAKLTEPATEPVAEPAHAAEPAPVTEPAAVLVSAAPPEPLPEPELEPNPLVIGGPGFWCSQRPAPPDAIVTECYRRKSTCEDYRGQRETKGTTWTPCQPSERAACFIMRDVARQAIGFRCFETKRECIAELPHYKKLRENMKLDYDECEWTTRAELSERGRAVARAGRPPRQSTHSPMVQRQP